MPTFKDLCDRLEGKPEFNFLSMELKSLHQYLLADVERAHLTQEQLDKIIDHLYQLVKATENLDVNEINKTKALLNEECSYSMQVQSKWTLIGLIVVGLAEAIALATILTILSIATSGVVTIPLAAVFGNILTASCVGAIFGHKMAEWEANTKINDVVGNSIKNYLEAKDVDTTHLISSRFSQFKKFFGEIKNSKDALQNDYSNAGTNPTFLKK